MQMMSISRSKLSTELLKPHSTPAPPWDTCAYTQVTKSGSRHSSRARSKMPKVANPTDMNTDFRQISVLPQMAKFLEKIQLKLNRKDLQIKESQHAFTEGRSTVTALTSVTQDWYNATYKGNTYEGVHAVFVDFSRAFDLVDHAILLTKLAGMGVNKSFWKWCQSFLCDITQQVKLPGALSNIRSVIAGVPQGGVISPTLFNVHINDIEDCIPGEMAVHTLKYADDCSQYELVPHGSNSRMQEAMNQLEGWAVQNKMVLNTKKTKDMWISFKKSTTAPPPTCIGSSVLERVAEFKLLGVHIRNDLKWNTHVHTIIKQVSKRIYHVRPSRKANLPKEVAPTARRLGLCSNMPRLSGEVCRTTWRTRSRVSKIDASTSPICQETLWNRSQRGVIH